MKTKLALLGIMAAWGLSIAATDTPKTYVPSEVQSLRLQVKQKDLQIAQQDYKVALERAQNAYRDLVNEGERVRTENKWPGDVKFDAGTLTFNETPKPEVKEAPKK